MWVKEDHEDGGIKGTGGKFQKKKKREGESRLEVSPTAQEYPLTKSYPPFFLQLFPSVTTQTGAAIVPCRGAAIL